MKRIVRYDPIHILSDINKLLEQNWYPLEQNIDNSKVETGQWVPAVDIKEEKDQFKIFIDLPGIDKKDIQIGMQNNVLTVQGDRYFEAEEKKDDYYRMERVTGKFYRRFTLPETADDANIHANLNKGVLEIHIHKKKAAQPKSIEIKGE